MEVIFAGPLIGDESMTWIASVTSKFIFITVPSIENNCPLQILTNNCMALPPKVH